MRKILTSFLLLVSCCGIAQTDTKTALKKFWKLSSFYENKGKWNSKLEGSMKGMYMHFRDGSVLMEVEDGDADQASWRYDESTKLVRVTYEGTDGDIVQDFKVISVSETEMELEVKDEEGNKTGMRFTARPYPFFPRLPVFLADLLYNLDAPYNEASTILKQSEYETEKTEMSNGIKITYYTAGSIRLFIYSKGSDITGLHTDIATKDYRAMRTELKKRGYKETYDSAQRELSYNNGNYHIIFHNIYDPKENGLQAVDVTVAIYDLNQMVIK